MRVERLEDRQSCGFLRLQPQLRITVHGFRHLFAPAPFPQCKANAVVCLSLFNPTVQAFKRSFPRN